jgi:hypothetical protein
MHSRRHFGFGHSWPLSVSLFKRAINSVYLDYPGFSLKITLCAIPTTVYNNRLCYVTSTVGEGEDCGRKRSRKRTGKIRSAEEFGYFRIFWKLCRLSRTMMTESRQECRIFICRGSNSLKTAKDLHQALFFGMSSFGFIFATMKSRELNQMIKPQTQEAQQLSLNVSIVSNAPRKKRMRFAKSELCELSAWFVLLLPRYCNWKFGGLGIEAVLFSKCSKL